MSQCQIENDPITALPMTGQIRSALNRAWLEAMRLMGGRQPWLAQLRLKLAQAGEPVTPRLSGAASPRFNLKSTGARSPQGGSERNPPSRYTAPAHLLVCPSP